MKLNNTILTTIFGLLLGISISYGVIQKRYANSLETSMYSIEDKLAEAKADVDSINILNDSLNKVIDSNKHLLDSLDVLMGEQGKRIQTLLAELSTIEDNIVNITTDSMYTELQSKYDKLVSVKKYPFSEFAVRGIYKDTKRLPYADGVLIIQDSVIDTQLKQLEIKDEIIKALGQGKEAQQELINNLYHKFSDTTIKLDMAEADNRHIRKILNVWKTTSIGGGAILVLLLLAL